MTLEEHFVNLGSGDIEGKREYLGDVREIIERSYRGIGGPLNISSYEDLLNGRYFWKLARKDGRIVAVVIYKTVRGGRKYSLLGSDGTPEGKAELFRIMQDDIAQEGRHAFGEFSGAPEHIFDKFGATPVPNDVAQKVLDDLGKTVTKLDPDGIHYERMIHGVPERKAMYGNVPERYSIENAEDVVYEAYSHSEDSYRTEADPSVRVYPSSSMGELAHDMFRSIEPIRIAYSEQGDCVVASALEYTHEDLVDIGLTEGILNRDATSVVSYSDACPADYVPETKDDGYLRSWTWEGLTVMGKDESFALSTLCETLGKPKDDTKWINESLLLEKTRQDLIRKSKAGAKYKSKDRQHQNRWDRRKYSSVANSVRDYNNINMDVFWKDDILEFVVKVHGETDDYDVTITFEHILRNLQDEVKSNGNKLEFKCVLRALLKTFNSNDVFVSCECKDFVFGGFNYYGVQQHYNSNPIGGKALQAPRINNPLDNKGAACKHINLVISNTDWMMKVASVINNYAKWCKDNMGRNYADYIFPKIYGMPYDRAVQLSLFDDPDDNGLLPTDQETISGIIDRSMAGRGEKGKWATGNEYRFSKSDSRRHPEDNPDQMRLQFGTSRNPRLDTGVEEPEEGEEGNA